ncbi:unnamed protein product [Leptosia nina]|uniref:Uncharacterized protein n=1 Tax=Leptosia nina TaxID=320188 RepID=A0AAV1JBD4_9NEOP
MFVAAPAHANPIPLVSAFTNSLDDATVASHLTNGTCELLLWRHYVIKGPDIIATTNEITSRDSTIGSGTQPAFGTLRFASFPYTTHDYAEPLLVTWTLSVLFGGVHPRYREVNAEYCTSQNVRIRGSKPDWGTRVNCEPRYLRCFRLISFSVGSSDIVYFGCFKFSNGNCGVKYNDGDMNTRGCHSHQAG